MKRLSGIAKFLLGFFIAIALLVGSGVAVALYFVTKLTALPPKPIFANEKPIAKAKAAPVAKAKAARPAPNNAAPTPVQAIAAGPSVAPTPSEAIAAGPSAAPTPSEAIAAGPSVAPTPTEAVATEPTPTPTPSETPAPKPLEPGAYRARVIWPKGLSLRSGPNLDSDRVGGVGYNERVVVLGESEDKRWLKVRLEETESEGWVKSGNIERVEEEQTQAANQ